MFIVLPKSGDFIITFDRKLNNLPYFMRHLAVFFLVIISFQSLAQNQMVFDVEDLTYVVAYLQDATKNNSGTGLFVKHNGSMFLLTAAHVAKGITNHAFVVIKLEGDKPAIIPISMLIDLNQPIAWKYHSIADLAILEVKATDVNILARLNHTSWASSQIDNSSASVSRDTDLIILGFPIIDQVGEYFSPLSFRSYPTSGFITLKRADEPSIKHPFMLLENPSVQGYSGGPVFSGVIKNGFTTFGNLGATSLIGIVHGTFQDNTGGKIAMITPAFYIMDLLK